MRLTLSLAGPVARALPWPALATGGVLGLLVVAVAAVAPVDLDTGMWVTLLRVAAACGALGVCFLLDDPARHTTAAVPAPRQVRLLLRPLLVLPAAAVWWAAVAVTARAAAGAPLPLADLTVEAAALVVLPVAVGTVALRWTDLAAPSPVTVPALLGGLGAAAFLPPGGTLLAFPGEDWDAAHRVWLGLASALPVAVVLLSREPAGRRAGRIRLPPVPGRAGAPR